MKLATIQSSSLIAARFLLSGVVQGVGMRPTVARLAQKWALNGFVRNDGRGVEIHVEGSADQIESFAAALRSGLPNSSDVNELLQTPAAVTHTDAFRIRQSDSADDIATVVPPDQAICPTCLAESLNPSGRRYNYPFVTCTDCGPRYSLIEAMPFDRCDTSMAEFEPCADCIRDNEAQDDRRFHAQTDACPSCGPQLEFVQHGTAERQSGLGAVIAAANVIRNGGIVAIKGVGGYQLVCDATCTSAVEQLRRRKQRPTKPLAVMATSIEEAEMIADLSTAARAELLSSRNAVVVVPSRLCGRISAAINPGLRSVGLMLPTSALHAMLLEEAGRPCVMTSGNGDGEPLAFRVEEAMRTLTGIADGWLHHNRAIVRPVDDSVVRIISRRPVTIRAARGLAPMSINVRCPEGILAVGGHQKVAIALSNGTQSVLGPHVGNMNSVATRQRFADHVGRFCELYRTSPTVIAHDLHPDYFTTRWAAEQHARTIAVQHHHAHTVAGMIEHRWLDREVLGVSFDGTGFGTDGTIWGGEFLVCSTDSFHRVARLRPFPLVGGDIAIREPHRIATALLHEAGIHSHSWRSLDQSQRRPSTSAISLPERRRDWSGLLERHRISFPLTSSIGRLFDGVAALVLNIADVCFEGEAAMRLEAACDLSVDVEYEIIICKDELMELDWRPMLREIVADINNDISVGVIATKFTRSIATAVAKLCKQFPHLPIVLSGGCFQNEILTELTTEALLEHPQQIGLPGKIPPNDGGLAAGQLAIASAQLQRRPQTEGDA